jgi:hypothetical protein
MRDVILREQDHFSNCRLESDYSSVVCLNLHFLSRIEMFVINTDYEFHLLMNDERNVGSRGIRAINNIST